MNYELAKQLKDAGFPQGTLPNYCDICFQAQYNDEGIDQCDCFMMLLAKYDFADPPTDEYNALTDSYIPSLSELIKACGDSFRNLTWHYTSQEWTACGIPLETRGKVAKEWKLKKKMRGGNTPEEAVAKLWLALNEKLTNTPTPTNT